MNNWPNKRSSYTNIIRRIAKIWSIVSLVFILVFMIGYGLNPEEPLPNCRELVELALFPTGVILGQILGWKREGLGGALSIGSLVSFYLLEFFIKGRFPGGPFFALVAAPGILFFICWIRSCKIGEKNK